MRTSPMPAAFAFLAATVSPWAQLEAVPAGLDWNELLALARRHRITPAFADGLKRAGLSAPPEQGTQMAAQCNAAILEELAHAASVRTICQVFDAAGLRHVMLKGVPLSLQIHGTLGLRVSRDIDLLVEPDDMRQALAILADQGFLPERQEMIADPAQLEALLASRKDIELFHSAKQQILELHWRLFDNPCLMPNVGTLQSERISLPMDFTCNVPPIALNLRYLALHGSQHGWSRLKWLLDFAALLGRIDTDARAALYAETRIEDGRRALGQAMILCEDLLVLPLDASLRQRILSDWRVPLLVRIARRCLIGSGVAELEDVQFGSTAKNLGHYLLMASPRYWLAEARFDLFDLSAVPERSFWRRFGGAGRFGAWLARHLSLRKG